MVLFPDRLKISRSLRKTLSANRFRVLFDTRFRDVMRACAAPRPDQQGTWITPEMVDAYQRLHELGYAHSVESYLGEELVGGLYGVALGAMYFGESMFTRVSDASKVAFVHLVRQLETWGFTLIDCQVTTTHLASLGAEEIRRSEFARRLAAALNTPDRPGPWRFDLDLTTD
jgi:leucyl/phenylalanyl-tRNA--protein transferase